MGVTELVGTAFTSGAAVALINWLINRGKTKRELKASDIDLSERIDQINRRSFAYIDGQLQAVQAEAALCRRRCDRYSELTLDLIDMLATHGITEIDEYRRRYREIRDLGRAS